MKKKTTKRAPKALLTVVLQPPAGKRRLPTRLSSWIVAAVKDARRLEHTKGFQLDMMTFNSISPEDKLCHVCLGGAAIVGRGLVAKGEGRNGPYSYMVADILNEVRTGEVFTAVSGFYGFEQTDSLPQDVKDELEKIGQKIFHDYEVGRPRKGVRVASAASWNTYLKAAAELRALGL